MARAAAVRHRVAMALNAALLASPSMSVAFMAYAALHALVASGASRGR